MKKIFLIFLTLLAVFMPIVAVNGQSMALADTKTVIQDGVCDASGQTQCKPAEAQTSINGIIKVILNLLSVVAGIAAVVMIVVSGLRYTTSGGDTNRVASAKNALLYAVVGLVIVALSQIIVRFVLVHTINN
jgi:hypothetical protein